MNKEDIYPLEVLADMAEEEGRTDEAILLRARSWYRDREIDIQVGKTELRICKHEIFLGLNRIKDNYIFWRDYGPNDGGWRVWSSEGPSKPAPLSKIKWATKILRRAIEKVNNGKS